MMDDLQQAYSAYQQALYHLRDPKVCPTNHLFSCNKSDEKFLGTQALVWNWNSLRSLWVTGVCRRGFLSSHANATRFRKSQRNLFSSRYNLQATVKIQSKSRGNYFQLFFKSSDKILICTSASDTLSLYHRRP